MNIISHSAVEIQGVLDTQLAELEATLATSTTANLSTILPTVASIALNRPCNLVEQTILRCLEVVSGYEPPLFTAPLTTTSAPALQPDQQVVLDSLKFLKFSTHTYTREPELAEKVMLASLRLSLDPCLPLAAAAADVGFVVSDILYSTERYRMPQLARRQVNGADQLGVVASKLAHQLLSYPSAPFQPQNEMVIMWRLEPLICALAAILGADPSILILNSDFGRQAKSLADYLLPLARVSWNPRVRYMALTTLVGIAAASVVARDSDAEITAKRTKEQNDVARDIGSNLNLTAQLLAPVARLFPDHDEAQKPRSRFNVAAAWAAAGTDGETAGQQLARLIARGPYMSEGAAARALVPGSGIINPPLLMARLLEICPSISQQLTSLRPDIIRQLSQYASTGASFPFTHAAFRVLSFCAVEGQRSGETPADLVPTLMPPIIAAFNSPFVAVRIAATDALRRMTRSMPALCAIREGAEIARLFCGSPDYWKQMYQLHPDIKEWSTITTEDTRLNARTRTNMQGPLTAAPVSFRAGPAPEFDPNAPLPMLFSDSTNECTAVTGVICNLVLFQSPVKQYIVPLILNSGIPVLSRLVSLATSASEPVVLVANSVWALRNLVFQAPRDLRTAVSTALGYEGLVRALEHPDSSVSVLGAALLRNLVWHVGTEEDVHAGLAPEVLQAVPHAIKILVDIVDKARSRQAMTRNGRTSLTFLPSESDALIHLVGIAHNLYSFPPDIVPLSTLCPTNKIVYAFVDIIGCSVGSIASAAIRACWNISRNERESMMPAIQAVRRACQSTVPGVAAVATELADRFLF